jgi:transposase InsO family protein
VPAVSDGVVLDLFEGVEAESDHMNAFEHSVACGWCAALRRGPERSNTATVTPSRQPLLAGRNPVEHFPLRPSTTSSAGERVGLWFIPPGEPWRNGYVESSTPGFATECLNITIFWTLTQARIMITGWKEDLNYRRRHSSLGYQAPRSLRCACTHR